MAQTSPVAQLPPSPPVPAVSQVSPINQTESAMAWDDLRTSPAFPAIIGGLAGAIGGVALMFVVTKLTQPKKALPAAYDANGNPMNIVYLPPPEQFRILGFTIGDLITLGTIGVSLFRQVQEMARENEANQSTRDVPGAAALPPPPPDAAKAAPKK